VLQQEVDDGAIAAAESPVVIGAAGRLRLVGTPRAELLPPAPAPASYGVGGGARIDGLA
jgi:hypothetical protein